MGKKSRLKKERKQNNFGVGQACGAKGQHSLAQMLEQMQNSGETIMTIEWVDGLPVVRGEADARTTFFEMVDAEFEHDDPSKLDELDAMGTLMGISILDATVKATNQSTGAVEILNLLRAAFCMDYSRVFEWVIQRAWNDDVVDPRYQETAWLIFDGLGLAMPGTPKYVMATHLANFMLESSFALGELEICIANSDWPQSTRGKEIVIDFKARIEAERERAELEAMLEDDDMNDSDCAEINVSAVRMAPKSSSAAFRI